MGPAHDGFEFLKCNFKGLKGYAVGRMTKSHRGKIYIDDEGWGPGAGSIEYGYRVPFGGIHVFIGKIGEPGPEPDICTDIVETAQRARSAQVKPAMKLPAHQLGKHLRGDMRPLGQLSKHLRGGMQIFMKAPPSRQPRSQPMWRYNASLAQTRVGARRGGDS